MASTQLATSSKAPLGMLKRLTQDTLLYEPPADAPADPAAPKLTIVFAWFAAADAHIAKYITQHLAIYPATRLLLVKCPYRRMFLNTNTDILPAIELLKTLPAGDVDSADPPPLQIHSFSNGGSYNLVRVAKLWRRHAPVLPRHTLILDSSPDTHSVFRTLKAFTASPPWWLRPAVYVVLGLLLSFLRLLRLRTLHDIIRTGLNDSTVLRSELRRTYVYSKTDEMVAWADVLSHAQAAADRAAKLSTALAIRTEEFVGSGHVSHARVDGDRYWGIVRETWQGPAAQQ